MKSNASKPVDREALLAAVRHSVEKAGGKRISLCKFMTATGISRHDMGKYFPRWSLILEAAGFSTVSPQKKLASNVLLADWGAVARKLNHLPTCCEYRIEGGYNPITIKRHFNGWRNVPAAFRAFAAIHPEWSDLIPLFSPPAREKSPPPSPRLASRWLTARQRARRGKQPIYGPRLNFGALHHAPVNEQGVVFLFGMLAEKLGFMVDALRSAFPDCEAKRRIPIRLGSKSLDDSAGWERVRIEFEYESRNFREHAHDPESCDLIICWSHNWEDCPLEVIELKEELKKLTSN
jgi:hypothetical protein